MQNLLLLGCLLLTAYCLLLTAYCLLPSVLRNLRNLWIFPYLIPTRPCTDWINFSES